MHQVGINSDVAEGFGSLKYGDDSGILPYIHVANIACGFHGGDPESILRTMRVAKQRQLKICAHPSLQDSQGFGRRMFPITPEALRAALIYQIGALNGFVKAEDLEISYLKTHGSLSDMATHKTDLAEILCDVAQLFDLKIMGVPGESCSAAQRRGIGFLKEFFVDLPYENSGRHIIAKDRPVDLEWIDERLRRALTEGVVDAIDGALIPFEFHTVSVHNDMPNASAVARTARATFDAVLTVNL